MKLLDRLTDRFVTGLGKRLQQQESGIARAGLPQFAGPAPGLVIKTPREIVNPQFMQMGCDVKIGPNSVLKATTSFPGGWLKHPDGKHVSQEFQPELIIGDRVTATWGLQVVAFNRVVIEEDVMLAGNVYISDGQHATERGDTPYKYQGIDVGFPVTIGKGTWIGQNVVILPGVAIGENAVIGANSVVSSNVPANALAVGSPAKLVRVWDSLLERWVKPDGANGSNRNQHAVKSSDAMREIP